MTGLCCSPVALAGETQGIGHKTITCPDHGKVTAGNGRPVNVQGKKSSWADMYVCVLPVAD